MSPSNKNTPPRKLRKYIKQIAEKVEKLRLKFLEIAGISAENSKITMIKLKYNPKAIQWFRFLRIDSHP